MEHAGKELKHCSKFEFIIEVYLLRGKNKAAFRISSQEKPFARHNLLYFEDTRHQAFCPGMIMAVLPLRI